MYPILAELKNKAKIDKRSPPYLYDYYNVKCFTTNPLLVMTDTLVRLVNCVIKGLNETAKLPRFIVVIPDQDIVKYVDCSGKSATIMLGAAIHWLITEMLKAVNSKKDELMRRRPGAVVLSTEPKFVWVKMINMPLVTKQMVKVRAKFNKLLENALVDKANHYIIDINQALSANQNYFAVHRQLSGSGKVKFWRELDTQIEQFDTRKRSLRPVHQEMQQDKNLKFQGSDTRYRFPPPKPKK